MNIQEFIPPFVSVNSKFTTSDIDSVNRLSGHSSISVTATTTDGKTVKLTVYSRSNKIYEFDSSRVYLDGTGDATIRISKRGTRTETRRVALDSVRFDLFNSGTKLNVVGVSGGSETFRISNMDVTRYSYWDYLH